MIRHPLHSAAGRTRPDLCRVTDGIAASLRQFSVSAQRNNPDDDWGDGPRRPTGRQRTEAAVDEIISMMKKNVTPSQQTPATSPEFSMRPMGRAQRPNVITLDNLSRGGLNGNNPRDIRLSINRNGDGPNRGAFGPNIIRGGFRGRGRGGSFSPSFNGGGGMTRGRGGGGGGGGRFNRDDRPRRGARGGAGGAGQRRRRRGNKDDKEGDMEEEDSVDTPRINAYLEEKETGMTMAFNPSLSLESLAGWGPAIATSTSPFGQGEVVLRQARILGGGQHFHPQHLMGPDDIRAGYRDGTGVFVPPSEEGKQWAKQVLKDKPITAPPEVQTAVLEDAILGKYNGPQYADPKDVLGTIRSYVKRDGTWNVQAERRIEEKVRALLSRGQPAGGAGAKEARPKA
ncbi:hypothetical protein F5Y06DRAFT_67490 [Hypoxylon sp. FL0890]|nr:hypothetical protein F5Y06DRAFT_67490 [Hypoxylon sp. FL0890]